MGLICLALFFDLTKPTITDMMGVAGCVFFVLVS
jgi:hypothetical protein